MKSAWLNWVVSTPSTRIVPATELSVLRTVTIVSPASAPVPSAQVTRAAKVVRRDPEAAQVDLILSTGGIGIEAIDDIIAESGGGVADDVVAIVPIVEIDGVVSFTTDDRIGVVAGAAVQRIVAGAAIDQVGIVAAIDAVVAAAAEELVGTGVADDDVCRSRCPSR